MHTSATPTAPGTDAPGHLRSRMAAFSLLPSLAPPPPHYHCPNAGAEWRYDPFPFLVLSFSSAAVVRNDPHAVLRSTVPKAGARAVAVAACPVPCVPPAREECFVLARSMRWPCVHVAGTRPSDGT